MTVVRQLLTHGWTLAVVLLASAQPSRILAQTAHVVVGPTTPVAPDPALPVAEAHVAVDPTTDGALIAAAIAFESASSVWADSRIDIFRSEDHGTSWDRTRLDMEAAADPWVAIDADGIAYLSYLAQPRSASTVHLFYRISRDGGRSWSEPMDLGTRHDREAMISTTYRGRPLTFLSSSEAARSPTGANWTRAFIARSESGEAFSPIARILPNNLQSNTLKLAATADGSVVVTLLDYADSNLEMLLHRRAWALVSSDGGETFSEPRFVAGDLAPRTSFDIAADPSDRFEPNRLYTARLAEQGAGPPQIRISRSDDLGASWLDLGPLDGELAVPRMPLQIEVDSRGTVFVAWFDQRHDRRDAAADLLVTASLDGGESFLPVQRVTPTTSWNGVPENGEIAGRFPTGGDYFGLAAGAQGGVHMVWPDSRSGVFALYHATARVEQR